MRALSALLCLALLAGGLMVLMLDLGRPERLIVAATHYNFTSVFAWNVFLYSGMSAVVVVYLWTMFERRFNGYTQAAGVAVLVWRFMLTSGTGLIFGFLVARQAYHSALLAPLFIVLSLGWGLAVFLGVRAVLASRGATPVAPDTLRRMARLLGIFVAASLYLVAVYHLTNLYYARQGAFEAFILLGRGGPTTYPLLFWLGYVLAGVDPAAAAAVPPPAAGHARHAGRLGAGRARRVRVAVCLHHRRAGLSAGHLPRLCRHAEQLRRRCGSALRAFRARVRCSASAGWRRPS